MLLNRPRLRVDVNASDRAGREISANVRDQHRTSAFGGPLCRPLAEAPYIQEAIERGHP